jgi:hypothetical protein
LIWEGEWKQARDSLDRTVALAHRMRLEPPEEVALCLLAQIDVLEGQPAAAVARLAPLVGSGVPWQVAVLLPTTLASAHLLRGEAPEAALQADQAVAEARRLNTWLAGVDAFRVRAQIAVRQCHTDLAASLLSEGLQRARGLPFPYAEARLLEVSALLDRQVGDDDSAHARLAEALAIYTRLGAQRDLTRLRATSLPL